MSVLLRMLFSPKTSMHAPTMVLLAIHLIVLLNVHRGQLIFSQIGSSGGGGGGGISFVVAPVLLTRGS